MEWAPLNVVELGGTRQEKVGRRTARFQERNFDAFESVVKCCVWHGIEVYQETGVRFLRVRERWRQRMQLYASLPCPDGIV